jgi:hypothetical protein
LGITLHLNDEIVPLEQNIKGNASIKNAKLWKIKKYFIFESPISLQRHSTICFGFLGNTKSTKHMFSTNQLIHLTNLKQGNKQHQKVGKKFSLFDHSCQHQLDVPGSI